MKTKTKKLKQKLSLNNKFDESMYYARWIALYEAINMIAEEAKTRKKNFDNLKLSPVKIKKYISSVEDQIQRRLLSSDLDANVL
jgi:hypothetical protein